MAGIQHLLEPMRDDRLEPGARKALALARSISEQGSFRCIALKDILLGILSYEGSRSAALLTSRRIEIDSLIEALRSIEQGEDTPGVGLGDDPGSRPFSIPSVECLRSAWSMIEAGKYPRIEDEHLLLAATNVAGRSAAGQVLERFGITSAKLEEWISKGRS